MDKSLDEIKALIRRKAGNPSTADLTNDQVSDAIDSALIEYSKNRPVLVLEYLTTIADTAEYSLSGKTGIMGIEECFYGMVANVFDTDFPGRIDLPGLSGIQVFHNPSIFIQYMQKVESYDRMFEGDYEWHGDRKKIELIPAPSSTGTKVYYVYQKKHTLATVPDEDEELFLKWAIAESLEYVMEKRGKFTAVSGYGQSVSVGLTRTEARAKTLKEEFKRAFGGTPILIG